MKRSIFFFLILFCIAINYLPAYGQLSNAGFESWTTSTQPDQWFTNNIPLSVTPVTRSSDAHSGSYALSGQVQSFFGIPYSPYVASGTDSRGFPVSQQYSQLTGFYKFSPDSGDRFAVTCVMNKAGAGVGAGSFVTSATISGYTQFTLTISYPNPSDIPDTGLIFITLLGDTVSNTPHVGSVFLLDDLSFGGSTGVTNTSLSPSVFRLEQNFPNPFNPATSISYSLPREEMVTITVTNLLGQDIATLLHGIQQAGDHSVLWNAEQYPSGLYFYRLTTKDYTEMKKMIYLK